MDGPVQAYWEKSKENLVAAEEARRTGSCNVAASRYYYALVLAGLALFERERKAYDDWPGHPVFIQDASDLFAMRRYGDQSEMKDALEEARQARVTADYEPYPVKANHLKYIFDTCEPMREALNLDLER